MSHIPPVPADVVAVAELLTHLKPMRRGGFSERFVKCSKKECRCAIDDDARHGPYPSITSIRKGKTTSRWLKPEQASLAQDQVAAARKFREHVESFWEATERWADAELDAAGAPKGETPKKGGSKRKSRRK